MTDRDYVTYRDTKAAPYRDTAEQWDAVKDRAVVPREIVRNRMRHGWALEPALTTPKEWKQPVAARIREAVKRSPGITAEGLRKALPDVNKSIIYRTVGRDVDAGRIRTIKAPGQNPDGWRHVIGYVLVDAPPTRTGRPHRDEEWTPGQWVHPIRARLLGLPVAEGRRDVPETDFGNPLRKVAA
jgi:hypothetical protein